MIRRDSIRGFSLIELVMTIVIVGIVAGILAPIITQSINAYSDTEARMELTARGRLALERLAKEIRQVVPNTVRELSSGVGVEFVTSKAGGRYMSRKDSFSPARYNMSNQFQKNANLSSLYILGTSFTTFTTNDILVIYNDSTNVLSSRSIGLNTITNVNADGVGSDEVQLLGFDSAKQWSVEPQTQHYQIIDYCHDVGQTGNSIYWRRTTGIGCHNNTADWQTTDPILVTSDTGLVADFDYIPTSLTSNAILKVTITLSKNGESVTMSQEMHVRNTP